MLPPRLTSKARRLISETIEAERAVGDREVAAALEVLMLVHDRVHGIGVTSSPNPQPTRETA